MAAGLGGTEGHSVWVKGGLIADCFRAWLAAPEPTLAAACTQPLWGRVGLHSGRPGAPTTQRRLRAAAAGDSQPRGLTS